MLIIRQLKRDLCEKAAYINQQFPYLNEQNIKSFKGELIKYDMIHNDLKGAINEYDGLKS